MKKVQEKQSAGMEMLKELEVKLAGAQAAFEKYDAKYQVIFWLIGSLQNVRQFCRDITAVRSVHLDLEDVSAWNKSLVTS